MINLCHQTYFHFFVNSMIFFFNWLLKRISLLRYIVICSMNCLRWREVVFAPMICVKCAGERERERERAIQSIAFKPLSFRSGKENFSCEKLWQIGAFLHRPVGKRRSLFKSVDLSKSLQHSNKSSLVRWFSVERIIVVWHKIVSDHLKRDSRNWHRLGFDSWMRQRENALFLGCSSFTPPTLFLQTVDYHRIGCSTTTHQLQRITLPKMGTCENTD